MQILKCLRPILPFFTRSASLLIFLPEWHRVTQNGGCSQFLICLSQLLFAPHTLSLLHCGVLHGLQIWLYPEEHMLEMALMTRQF